MTENSKVIKINCDLFDRVQDKGIFVEVLRCLLNHYDPDCVEVTQDYRIGLNGGCIRVYPNESPGEFMLIIKNKCIPINVTGVTKSIRVPVKIYNQLLSLKSHPEESFSFLIFKMLEYYENWYMGTQDIFTIGSDGKKIPEFIEILMKNGLETVLDVRKSAKSPHVPEFSEKSLSDELTKIDIKYVHKEELGVPYEIVRSYTNKNPIDGKESLTDIGFEGYYRDKISDEIDIDKLVREMKEYGKTVLLCACAYAVKTPGKQKYNCHRSLLANTLLETGEFKEIIHL
jgi:predicted CopG family antitoxin